MVDSDVELTEKNIESFACSIADALLEARSNGFKYIGNVFHLNISNAQAVESLADAISDTDGVMWSVVRGEVSLDDYN